MNKGKHIYIIDFIGSYCGMDYYDKAFAHILNSSGFDVRIFSNFDSIYGKQFFPKIFGRNKLISLLLLIVVMLRIRVLMAFRRNAHFIYLSYGEYYDILFLLFSWPNRRLIVDVHEVHALKYGDESKYSIFFKSLYKKNVPAVIYHSNRTKNILSNCRYLGKMIYVPHFKYEFDINYDINNVGMDIRNVFVSDRIKYLFFGNFRLVKGIDVVEDVFLKLSAEKIPFELVVAGMNAEKYPLERMRTIASVFDRHINDDEMKFLYSNCDYVLLPYRKSSQSGIFEMASYFKKPMVLSDIDYFKNQLEIHPDWGLIAPIENYIELVKKTLKTNSHFYVNCYNQSEGFYKNFIEELKKII